MEPDIDHFQDKSEETVWYPPDWPGQKRALHAAEKRLLALWVAKHASEDSEESSEESNSEDGPNRRKPEDKRNPETDAHPDGDGDTRMSIETNEGQTSSSSRETSASTDSGGSTGNSTSSRETTASTNGEDHRTKSSLSGDNSSVLREGTASSEPEGDYWPHFDAKVKNQRRWAPIKAECKSGLYACDFADIMFRYEIYCELEHPDTSEQELLKFARGFMEKCWKSPAATLEALEEMFKNAGIFKYSRYRASHPRPPPPSSLNRRRDARDARDARDDRDASVMSDDLDRDRRERGFERALRPATDGWQDIVLARDPDGGPGEVTGKIQLVIGRWLDVSLPSLNPNNPDKERHFLVPASDYKDKREQFCGSTQGQKRHFTKSSSDSCLAGLLRSEVTVMYYTFELHQFGDRWPDGYAVGYVTSGNEGIRVWPRGKFALKFGKGNIDYEANREREEVGQHRITTESRPRPRRLANRDR